MNCYFACHMYLNYVMQPVLNVCNFLLWFYKATKEDILNITVDVPALCLFFQGIGGKNHAHLEECQGCVPSCNFVCIPVMLSAIK